MFVCDTCQEVIRDHASAIAVYPSMGTDGSMDQCYHVHKNQCDEALKAKPGVRTGWQDLRHHLQWLSHNVRLTPKDLAEDEFDRIMQG